MAQLNGYTNSEGDSVDVPLRPTNPYDPNGIARITPEASRPFAKAAYKVWADAYDGTSEETLFGNILPGDDVNWAGGTYLTLTDGTTDGYVWFTHDGVGTDPEPGILTELGQVGIYDGDTAVEIAEKLYNVLAPLVNIEATYIHGSTQISVRNLIPGIRTDATVGTLTGGVIPVTISTQGIDPDTVSWDGLYNDGAAQNLNYR